MGTVVYATLLPGGFSAADKRELMEACRYEVPDGSARRCADCMECLHRNITITCQRRRTRAYWRRLPSVKAMVS